ncbi:MAG: lycopene cyclase domain-containing protein [Schleiferiaceae bacterium]|nr:lycopene cyclase domain-containing protein [Schleiferiaceae bacterium]
MLETPYLYLGLMIFTIAVPLIRSFEHRIAYYKSFDSLFLSIAIMGSVFIAWDMVFTNMGIWGFNPDYLIGVNIINLPLEECLFFVAVPFSCVFIYRVLNYFIAKDYLLAYQKRITNFLFAFSLAIAVFHYDKWYPFVTFLLLALYLGYMSYFSKATWPSRFYMAYLVILIPFLIVNGVLTGTGIESPIVWYNDAENLSIRLGTIPVEDAFYGFLLLMGNVHLYEYFESRKTT